MIDAVRDVGRSILYFCRHYLVICPTYRFNDVEAAIGLRSVCGGVGLVVGTLTQGDDLSLYVHFWRHERESG